MAALRTERRSANIDETHSRLDEHHVERLIGVREGKYTERAARTSTNKQAERNTVDAVRGATEGRQARQGAAGTRARVIEPSAGGHLPRSRFGLEG